MKTTLRQDPSTQLVHLGTVKRFDDRWDDRWVPLCGTVRFAIDTVFWDTSPEVPTCLWCVLKGIT
jgi:hypothetical protein